MANPMGVGMVDSVKWMMRLIYWWNRGPAGFWLLRTGGTPVPPGVQKPAPPSNFGTKMIAPTATDAMLASSTAPAA